MSDETKKRTAEDVWLDALKVEIRLMLSGFPARQQAFFARCCPEGVDGMALGKAKTMYALCRRTVDANLADASKTGVSR